MTAKDNIKSASGEVDRPELAHLFPPVDDWSRIRVTCRSSDYSAGAIVRAVEDSNAHVLNLNVTDGSGEGLTEVELRINLRDPMAAVRSLERYGFSAEIIDAVGDSQEIDDMRRRVDELIHYLEI